MSRSFPGKQRRRPLGKAAAWKSTTCAFCLSAATHIAMHDCGDPTCWHPQMAVCRWCLKLMSLAIGESKLAVAARVPPLKWQQKKAIKNVEKLIRANRPNKST